MAHRRGKYKPDQTAEQQQAVIESLLDGASRVAACKAATLPRRTFYDWLDSDAAFAARVASAEVHAVETMESVVYAAGLKAEDDPWYLCAAIRWLEQRGRWQRSSLVPDLDLIAVYGRGVGADRRWRRPDKRSPFGTRRSCCGASRISGVRSLAPMVPPRRSCRRRRNGRRSCGPSSRRTLIVLQTGTVPSGRGCGRSVRARRSIPIWQSGRAAEASRRGWKRQRWLWERLAWTGSQPGG
ncbi:MAG: hypothetical protein IH820_10410, partial [Bacteroidetes bacterium]|nr:hypothetical protein [Bacteroidota bacterium]